jgi:hypothetical protein
MDTGINLKRIERETAIIEIRGTAPLIVHAWSTKAKEMMLASQQGKKTPKQPKDPKADFEASRYRMADGTGDGFPTTAFKAATVKGGGRAFGKSVKMTEMRQALLFIPDGLGLDNTQLTRLVSGEPTMREDLVRVGMGTADLRYRAMYEQWSAVLSIQFFPQMIDLGSVAALVDAGGANGVGEWRPERSGSFGTFEVVGEELA